jgi:hypothetical protein
MIVVCKCLLKACGRDALRLVRMPSCRMSQCYQQLRSTHACVLFCRLGDACPVHIHRAPGASLPSEQGRLLQELQDQQLRSTLAQQEQLVADMLQDIAGHKAETLRAGEEGDALRAELKKVSALLAAATVGDAQRRSAAAARVRAPAAGNASLHSQRQLASCKLSGRLHFTAGLQSIDHSVPSTLLCACQIP